jgi:hypothetical protein
VIHILSDFEGLKDGWVAMSLDYGAAPIDQHECNSNSMESYSFSDCFGWEKVKCNVCGKVDGKPIGEMYRKDGNYR